MKNKENECKHNRVQETSACTPKEKTNKQKNRFSPQRHSFPLMVCLAHQSKCTLSEKNKMWLQCK